MVFSPNYIYIGSIVQYIYDMSSTLSNIVPFNIFF